MNDLLKSKKLVHELEQLRHKIKASELENYLHQRTLSKTLFITDSVGNSTYICPNAPVVMGCQNEEIQQMGNIQQLLGEKS